MKPVPRSASSSFFERLLRENRALVRGVAIRAGVPPTEVDDVVQRIAEHVAADPAAVPGLREVRGWLRTVTIRQSVDQIRERKRALFLRSPRAQKVSVEAGEAPSAEELLIVEETSKVIREEIAQLEPMRREVLVRHDLDGETMEVIAAALGLKVATGYNVLRLARSDLRRALERRAAVDKRKTGERSFGLFVGWWSWDAAERRRAVPGFGRRPAIAFVAAMLFFVCSEVVPPPARSFAGSRVIVAGVAATEAANEDGARGGSVEVEAAPPVVVAGSGPSKSERQTVPRVHTEPRAAKPARRESAPGSSGSSRSPRSPGSPGSSKSMGSSGSSRNHDLAIPRALIDRAQRAVAKGDWAGARAALGRYDAEAPDDPFPVVRAAIARVLRGAPLAR